jgi:O-acetyl-ADP-ribose deacetylase (regulator of RNase III)
MKQKGQEGDGGMPLLFVKEDITKMKVDAIVNAANTELRMGSGVCGAIFHAAGEEKMTEACQKLSPIRTGEAVMTDGFALPAGHVIHAAGPVYQERELAESALLLAKTYQSALALAAEHRLKSVAFPLISAGIYGYPKDEALSLAVWAIRHFLEDHEMDVYLAFPDKSAFVPEEYLVSDVEEYMAEGAYESVPVLYDAMPERAVPKALKMPAGLDHWVHHLDEPFNEALLRLIDDKGMTDTEVYKKANIDRRHFSKIRTGKGYTPKKPAILALAIALELDLDEAEDLLAKAGYAFSPSRKFDVIVQYFIIKGQYDIDEINEVLFHYDQPLLGG